MPDTLYLNLNQTIELALKRSPRAIEINATRAQSALTIGKGLAGILPQPQAGISAIKTETGTSWNGEIGIGQVIFDPVTFSALISSIINAENYSYSAREQLCQLIYSVTTDYLNLLRSRQLLNAAKQALTGAETNYQLTEQKFKLGQLSKIDLLRSQTYLTQARLNLLSAEKTYETALNSLRVSSGITTNKIIEPVEQLNSELPEIQPETLRQQIARFNPGLKMSRDLNKIATLNLLASLLRILPVISLNRSFQYQDTIFPKDIKHWQDHSIKTEGITISFPVADLARFILNVWDALLAARRSQAQLTRTKLELTAAVENAILDYQEARQRYEFAQQNLKLNQELYELARTRFQLGALALPELLEIESGLAQAQASFISATCDVYIQSAQIGYLMGITRMKK